MGWFGRQPRRLTTWLVLATMLFAHSALAVAACIAHVQPGRASVAHHHGADATGHDHASGHVHANGALGHDPSNGMSADTHQEHGASLLCKIGCEAQAQARTSPNTLEDPVPVVHKVAVLVPLIVELDWPTYAPEPQILYASAAPPPLPLTILLSRFRN